MDGWIVDPCGWMDGRVDGQTGGYVNEWVDGWMDEWEGGSLDSLCCQ
jgi:hypothetical protein